MSAVGSSNDYGPIRYVGRVPVYLTTILVAMMVLGLLIVTLAAASQSSVALLGFSTQTFYQRFFVWQPVTAPFVNAPSFFFLFGVFCVYSWGTEVERFLGRERFAQLIGVVLLTPVIVLGLWHLAGIPEGYAGLNGLLIGFIVAFATIYPNIEYFGWVPLKYVAFGCIGIGVLGNVAMNDWAGMTTMLAQCATAFGFIRWVQQGGEIAWPNPIKKILERRPRLRVLPTPQRPRDAVPRRAAPPSPQTEELDALLDKISKSGLNSLSEAERSKLERAREDLLRRGK